MLKIFKLFKSQLARVNIKFNHQVVNQIFTFLVVVLVTGVIFQTFETQKEPIVPQADNSQFETPPKTKKINHFLLEIPSLDINVPIIANVDGYNQEKYLKALERGVAHFAGTSLPGEGGNIVIFGHSSYYRHQPGNYKEIFAPLPDLKIGDLIKVDFNQQKFKYYVSQIETVSPKAVKYLNQTENEQLTLITCVPPGTTKYRLIIITKPK